MVILDGSTLGSSYICGLFATLAGFMLFNTSVLHATKPGPSYSGSLVASSPYPTLVLKVIVGFALVPFFVVIKMTPLAALAPNTAAELASFNTSILLISFGFISARS